MAQAIVTYCDICLSDDDVYEVGSPLDGVQIGKARPRTLDLCERHRKEYVTPLEDLLQRLGTAIDKARAPITPAAALPASTGSRVIEVADEQCPLCGEVYRRTSGESHFASKHPTASRARLFLERGLVDAIFECDFGSGKSKCDKAFLSRQGLGMHKMRSHGLGFDEQA